MAKKGTIGGKIVLDGEKEYRQALNSIQSAQKTLNSEMKLATAQYKDNANSTDALKSKQQVLTKQIEEQKNKINVYREALSNASTNLNKCADNVNEWKSKLSSAEDELQKLKSNTNASNEEIAEQEKKVLEAKNALSQAESQYSTVSRSVNSWTEKMNNANAEMYGLNSELKKNDGLLDEAKNSTDGCAKSIDKYGKEVKTAEEGTSTFGSVLKANLTSQAIIAGIKTMVGAVKSLATNLVELGTGAAAYADDMMTMSTQTGISTDELQALNYMAELTDTSLEDITKTMAKNIKSMDNASQGSERYVNAYEKLGVAITNTDGTMRSTQEVYWEAIDALGQMENATDRDAIAMQLFGKSAQALNPLIAVGKKGVADFSEEARRMGAILDKDTLSSLGETDDAFQRFTQQIEITKRKIGASLAPILTQAFGKIGMTANEMGDKIAEVVSGAVQGLIDAFNWVIDHGEEIKAVIKGIVTALVLTKAINGVSTLITSFISLKEAIAAASTASAVLSSTEALGGIGLAAGIVGGVSVALIGLMEACQYADDEYGKLMQSIDESKESAKELKSEVENLHNEFESNSGKVSAEADSANKLADELFDLSEKSKLTAEEQRRMSNIVDLLNQKYPELNLELDKNTNKLNMTRQAVKDLIDAQKQQALYEVTYDAQKKAMKVLFDATTKQTEAENELTDAKKGLADAEKEELKTRQAMDKANQSNASNLDDLVQAHTNAVDKVNQYTIAVDDANDALEKQNGAVESAQAKADDLSNRISDFAEKQGIATESTDTLTNSMQSSADTAEDTGESIEESYKKAYQTAYDSLEGQLGLWDKFEGKSEKSGKELMKNLKSQVDGIEDWQENLTKISEVCGDDFVQALRDMGIGSAGEIAELAKMSKSELEKYEDLWREKSQAMAEATVNTVKGMSGDIVDAQEDLLDDQAKNNHKWKDQGQTMGEMLGKGTVDGLNNYSTLLSQKATSMCTAAVEAMRQALDVHSPSRKSTWLFEMVGEGAVKGLNNKIDDVRKASAMMSNASLGSLATSYVNTASGGVNGTNYDMRGLIRSEVSSAIKGLTIEVDSKVFGKVVDNHMRRSMA